MTENYIETKQRLINICNGLFARIGWDDLEWHIDDPDSFCNMFTLVIGFRGTTVSRVLNYIDSKYPTSSEAILYTITECIGHLAWVRAHGTAIELARLLREDLE